MIPQEGAPGSGNPHVKLVAKDGKLVNGDLSEVRPGLDVKSGSFGKRAAERGAAMRNGAGGIEEFFADLGATLQRGRDFVRGAPAEVGALIQQGFSVVGSALERLGETYVDTVIRIRAKTGGVRFYDPDTEELTRPVEEAWKLAVLGTANRWASAQALYGRLVSALPRTLRQQAAFWRNNIEASKAHVAYVREKSKERDDINRLDQLQSELMLKMDRRARLLKINREWADKELIALDAEIQRLRGAIAVLENRRRSAMSLKDTFFNAANDNEGAAKEMPKAA